MIDKNDPRLTQYVLGELDDNDALAIENELANSPELQSIVEEIREVTVALENEFQSELLPSLLADQVSEVVSFASEQKGESDRLGDVSPKKVDAKASVSSRPTTRIYWGAAVAVSIAILSGALLLKDGRIQTQRQVTNLDDSESNAKSEVDDDISLESLVSEFNTLLEEQRFDEAVVVANKAVEKFPASDVTHALVWKSKFATRMRILNESQSNEFDSQNSMASTLSASASIPEREPLHFAEDEVRLATDLYSYNDRRAENIPRFYSSEVPFGDRDVIVHPTDEFWSQIEMEREKHRGTDLLSPPSAGSGAGGMGGMTGGMTDGMTGGGGMSGASADGSGADGGGAGGMGGSGGRASSSDGKPIERVETIKIPGKDIVILKGDPQDTTPFRALIKAIDQTDQSDRNGVSPELLKTITKQNSKNKTIQEKDPVAARAKAEADQPAHKTESTEELDRVKSGEKKGQLAKTISELKGKVSEKRNDKQESKQKKSKSWKRVEAIPNTSRLMIGDKDELEMQGVQANVKIDGFRARILLDCFYYNDRDKQLEGNFKIRLPDDSSLFYFAFGESVYSYSPEKLELTKNEFDEPNSAQFTSFQPNKIADHRKDDWKNVKEARCVEKQKAAFAYLQTVKRRVDPALVEWAGAGVFNAKIFPLASKKMHRIVIGYDVDLKKVAADWQFQFAVPKTNRQTKVNIDVKRMDGVEVTSSIDQKPMVTDDSIRYHFQNPTEAFQINLKDSQPVWLVNKTNDIFATMVIPDFGDEKPEPTSKSESAEPVQSKRAVFLLDTSLSSDPDKFNVWLKLLKKVLNQNRDQIDEFAVLNFNIESFWWKNEFTPNTKANVTSLLADCNRLVLEGATDFHAVMSKLNSTQWVSQSNLPIDCFLLSDGAATWGETQLARIQHQFKSSSKPKRLIAYQTGYTGTAIRSLRSLAQNSGGAVFSIANEGELGGVAKAHRIQPWKLDSIEIDGAREILTAGRVQWIYPGQPITIVGKSLAPRGQGGKTALSRNVVLNVSRNSHAKKLRIPIFESIQSDLAERTYGQVVVGQLESLGQLEKELSIAYARNFQITGQNCSLLMLESEADYKRFEINKTDDQMVIKTSLVDKVIAARTAEFENSVTSPKLAVQNWLKRLENAPGQRFKIPTALSYLVSNLEDHHFEISQSEVKCEARFSAEKTLTRKATAKKNPTSLGDFFNERLPAKADSDALRELSSFIENQPGDMQLAKAIAQGAIDMESPSHAFFILRRVAEMRPFDSDIYMLLGRCLSELDQFGYAIVCYEIAMNSSFTNRKSDFQKIVAYDYARVLRKAIDAETEEQIRQYAMLKLKRINEAFNTSDQDLVIRLSWNTDGSDVDLHVTEPNGDVCFYKHPKTVSGGKLTADITDGFGPELYLINNAPRGKYKIQVKYYSQNGNRTSSASQATVEVIENYGRKNETSFRKTVSLSGDELIDVATVAVEK